LPARGPRRLLTRRLAAGVFFPTADHAQSSTTFPDCPDRIVSNAFRDGDDFQLFSANAGIGFYSTLSADNPITANAPAPGDTALTVAPTMTQGAVTDVAGAMVAPPSRTVAVDYRLGDTEALGDDIATGSIPVFAGLLTEASGLRR
jgi:hypothetical protein